jgi:hypothetical protein
MLMVIAMFYFIIAAYLAQSSLLNQSQAFEKSKTAVYGGYTYRAVLLTGLTVELFGIYMAAGTL